MSVSVADAQSSADLSNSLAAALLAVDPVGLGGAVLRSAAGAVRDAWLASLRGLMPAETPYRRIPVHVDDDTLLGGLDLAATLRTSRPVALRGLLSQADGGVVVLSMAERAGTSAVAALCAVLDTRRVSVERHGVGTRVDGRIGVIALDEGIEDDERVADRLRDRLAFHLTLAPSAMRRGDDPVHFTRDDIADARAMLPFVRLDDDVIEGLCAAALALGVDSPRAALFATRVARVSAALDHRDRVDGNDAALAAALVLAPRATRVPSHESEAAEPEHETPPETEAPPEDGSDQGTPDTSEDDIPDNDRPNESVEPSTVDDVVLEAALAAIPRGLLMQIAGGHVRANRRATAGRVGAERASSHRGRPLGVRSAGLQGGARLNLIETLRAAAPWQSLRRREDAGDSGAERGANSAATLRIQVRQEDFRIWRFRQRSETTTIFVVDASGSAALHRLAETKGAVELLLADCYVRRDSVAVIAFRGARAELLLSPTRSLVRAKRSLAGLPGGGGTPLAAGLAAACTLVEAVRRKGATPLVVLLTDGRANVASDGSPGRGRATDDAMAGARRLKAIDVAALLLDTSPQAQAPARLLAEAMGARYLPMPYADANAMSEAVRYAGGAGQT